MVISLEIFRTALVIVLVAVYILALKKMNEIVKNRKEEHEVIKVKYFNNDIDKIEVNPKGNWVDLRAAGDFNLKKGEVAKIPLGIGMILPKGYEAITAPRSSSFKNFKTLQTNSIGVIDEPYCGDNDQWFLQVIAMEDTEIHFNDRVCQFRIVKHQPKLTFVTVHKLKNEDRGGHGSTGVQ